MIVGFEALLEDIQMNKDGFVGSRRTRRGGEEVWIKGRGVAGRGKGAKAGRTWVKAGRKQG